jgi:hypothetical protein
MIAEIWRIVDCIIRRFPGGEESEEVALMIDLVLVALALKEMVWEELPKDHH